MSREGAVLCPHAGKRGGEKESSQVSEKKGKIRRAGGAEEGAERKCAGRLSSRRKRKKGAPPPVVSMESQRRRRRRRGRRKRKRRGVAPTFRCCAERARKKKKHLALPTARGVPTRMKKKNSGIVWRSSKKGRGKGVTAGTSSREKNGQKSVLGGEQKKKKKRNSALLRWKEGGKEKRCHPTLWERKKQKELALAKGGKKKKETQALSPHRTGGGRGGAATVIFTNVQKKTLKSSGANGEGKKKSIVSRSLRRERKIALSLSESGKKELPTVEKGGKGSDVRLGQLWGKGEEKKRKGETGGRDRDGLQERKKEEERSTFRRGEKRTAVGSTLITGGKKGEKNGRGYRKTVISGKGG